MLAWLSVPVVSAKKTWVCCWMASLLDRSATVSPEALMSCSERREREEGVMERQRSEGERSEGERGGRRRGEGGRRGRAPEE